MSANLILHWSLDATGDGGQAIDDSPNHLNGTARGGPLNVPDERFGSCLGFDGADDLVKVDPTPLLRLPGYTIEAWIRPGAQPQGAVGVFGSSTRAVRLQLDRNGILRHCFSTTASPDDGHTFARPIVGGEWQHVAVTNDGETARAFIDGTPAGTYAPTGTRAIVDNPMFAGSDGVSEHLFAGRMAHMRVYDGPLTQTEIQRDMADDEAALAAFVRAHPLDFALWNTDMNPVMYITDAPAGLPMTLHLTNTSRQDLELVPLTGTPSEANHHLALRLRPGTLAPACPATVSTSGWTLLRSGDTLYFLATTQVRIGRGESLDLALDGMNADGSSGTRGTRVEMTYQQVRYLGQTEELTGTRIQFLDIVNHRGRKDIPLVATFLTGDTVTNDGLTPSELQIRLTNSSRDLPIALGGSAFTLSFEFQGQSEQRPWALTNASGAGTATLTVAPVSGMTGAWEVKSPENLGQRRQWTLTPAGADAAFGPDGSITLTLKVVGLVSAGHAAITVGYQDVPGYQDGALTLTAVKSPLMFSEQFVGIGTRAPVGRLQIIDANRDSNGTTLVLGPTNQSNLRLGYHANYSWIQSHGVKPLALNRLGNNVGIGTTEPNARLTVATTASHLELRREASLGSGGKVMYLELYQHTTSDAGYTYPSIRFHHGQKFSHRIEGRPEGFAFKHGDLATDTLSDVYAATAVVNQLTIGATTIGAEELAWLKLAAHGFPQAGG